MAAPKKKNENTVPGNSLRIMNMSENDHFCKASGKKLPRNGMVWQHGDDLFVNRRVASVYLKNEAA